jgi:nucleotide-binding universal stress UspA family protein
VGYSKICLAVALQRYLDITPLASRLGDLAAVLARAHRAPLAVVSVEAPVELLPDVETMAEKLERFVAPLRSQGVEVNGHLRRGRPSREIASFIDRIGADLLLIGSHSKRGVMDVGLGSTASALMRDLDVTILMVRPTSSEQEAAEELKIPRYPLVFPYG